MSERNWFKWSEKRPSDNKAPYRWRVAPRLICKKMLAPEWTGKMRVVGMGVSPYEYWPEGSHWDGWVRTIDKTLEWAPIQKGEEDENTVIWHGFDLLPCPFTGNQPKVVHSTPYIGAPIWKAEGLCIRSYICDTKVYYDANQLEKVWNRRP